jgi:hypothetical protein
VRFWRRGERVLYETVPSTCTIANHGKAFRPLSQLYDEKSLPSGIAFSLSNSSSQKLLSTYHVTNLLGIATKTITEPKRPMPR